MKVYIIIGSISAFIAVLLGAFGAHMLKSKVQIEDLTIFETGVRYQMYHSIALILLGIIGFHFSEDITKVPAILFILGIIIFSGTLYFLVLTNIRFLGAFTPIGGMCFLVGWLLLAFNIFKN